MAAEDTDVPIGYKVDGRWEIQRKLGQGAFGAVYEVVDITKKITGSKALKIESLASADLVLKIEVAVLDAMCGSEHMCQMYANGKNDRFNFLVMSLLGPNLGVLRKKVKGQKLSMSTTMIVTWQCVEAIKDMHNAGWLHRDIKPTNFAMGHTTLQAKRRIVYILDFGMARMFRYQNGNMKSARSQVGFRGTLRYCPLNAHKNMELGRQDDLLSLLYMMVEMSNGSLPWKTLESIQEVQMSKEARAEKLFENVSIKFSNLYKNLNTLKFSDEPEYIQFENAIKEHVSDKDLQNAPLDWDVKSLKAPTRTKSKKTAR